MTSPFEKDPLADEAVRSLIALGREEPGPTAEVERRLRARLHATLGVPLIALPAAEQVAPLVEGAASSAPAAGASATQAASAGSTVASVGAPAGAGVGGAAASLGVGIAALKPLLLGGALGAALALTVVKVASVPSERPATTVVRPERAPSAAAPERPGPQQKASSAAKRPEASPKELRPVPERRRSARRAWPRRSKRAALASPPHEPAEAAPAAASPPAGGEGPTRASEPELPATLPVVAEDALVAAEAREPSAATTGGTLARERGQLDQAQRALQAGDARRAEALLARYRASFGHGFLREEADALHVQTLVALQQHAAASRAAERFRRRYPGSLLGSAVESALRRGAKP